MKMNTLLIGNLTIDHNKIGQKNIIGPGGSVYFCAKTYENLEVLPTIISPYGSDFPKSFLPKTSFYPKMPIYDKTLVFENIYPSTRKPRLDKAGMNGFLGLSVRGFRLYLEEAPHFSAGSLHLRKERYQKVRNFEGGGIGALGKLPRNLWENKEIVVVAPIIDNITAENIREWRKYSSKSLFILTAQGFFRQIGKKGQLSEAMWKNSRRLVSFFDIIVVSDKDGENLDRLALHWSLTGPIAIVTKEERGCSVYQKGKRIDSSGFKVTDIIDATGAGDVFAAAFSFAYLKSNKIKVSADFANSTAALSLRFSKNKLKYEYRDIIEFAKSQGRRISLCLY